MKKDGKYKEKQLWRCKDCWKQSSEKRKEKCHRIWKEYAHGKQTYAEIGEQLKRSKRWVQQQMDLAEVKPHLLQVGDVVVVPGYDRDEDHEAMEKIQQAMPAATVFQVPCRTLAEKGGVLNCISWTIKGKIGTIKKSEV